MIINYRVCDTPWCVSDEKHHPDKRKRNTDC